MRNILPALATLGLLAAPVQAAAMPNAPAAVSKPAFELAQYSWPDWWRDRDRRDRDRREGNRRYRDCHREPDRHAGVPYWHRHAGRDCRIVRLRPYYGAPRNDQVCVQIGPVRFCDDFR